MPDKRLMCGLLDISTYIQDQSLSEWARSLTISWLRFKYTGEILESEQVNQILDEAVASGYEYCLLQCYGQIILEHWQPGDENAGIFLGTLLNHMQRSSVPVLKSATSSDVPYPAWMLVDLQQYRQAGKPRFPSPFFRDYSSTLSPESGLSLVDLGFGSRTSRELLAEYKGMNILNYQAEEGNFSIGHKASQFLQEIKSATENSQRGIFLWNFEPYNDIEALPAGFHRPLSSLYSVAAGLKSNRILETHGFDSKTRVVFFDYSGPGLKFKQLLLEEWDGSDYPGFIHRIQEKLPPGEAYYWLWETPNPDEMAQLWSQELDRWGGEQSLRQHWQHYRQIRHRFVLCNLLADAKPLFNEVAPDGSSVIWWSNAFSTVYSNWHHTLRERREIFGQWITGLAARASDLYLYGADWSNISVNSVTASDYAKVIAELPQSELVPRKICREEIRF